jgi:hypothetical protein
MKPPIIASMAGIAGLLLVTTTAPHAGWRVHCREQARACRKTQGASILLPPTELTLSCNGHVVRCIQTHSSTAAPDYTYCNLVDLRTFCGLQDVPQ